MAFEPSKPVTLGWIDYLNLRPLRYELQRTLNPSQVEFRNGHPAQVNRWLADREVQIAPASSIALLKFSDLEMLMPFGIASEGTVQSVYLGFPKEYSGFYTFLQQRQEEICKIARDYRLGGDARKFGRYLYDMTQIAPGANALKCPPIKFTSASATSVMLSKIFLRLWLGQDVFQDSMSKLQYQSPDVSSIELLIGDEALEQRYRFAHVIDLGAKWNQLTDLPFVFAVWQMSQQVSAKMKHAIFEAAELADMKMRIDPSVYLPENQPVDDRGQPIDLIKYWQAIQYKLTPNHFKGLITFFCFAKDLLSVSEQSGVVEKIMRWQQMRDAQSFV